MNTNFHNDIAKGKFGENIFKEDFLNFLNINYEDVTGCQKFQIIDSDYLAKIGLYEIKTNYYDNKLLYLETHTNINEDLGKISYGWLNKTKADIIIFISKKTRTMVFLPFNENFKIYLRSIYKNYTIFRNKISIDKKGNRWQSAFIVVPFCDIKGFISIYKKLT